MSVDTASRTARIKEIVCDVLEIDEEEMTATSHFIDDHDADSLLAIEILALLEKEFKVTIEQSELPRMVTVTSVYEVVAESAGW